LTLIYLGLHQTQWAGPIKIFATGTELTEANTCFVALIWTTANVGAALAANNPSDRDEFAAEAAPTKLKTSVFSVISVAMKTRYLKIALYQVKSLIC